MVGTSALLNADTETEQLPLAVIVRASEVNGNLFNNKILSLIVLLSLDGNCRFAPGVNNKLIVTELETQQSKKAL